MVRGPVFVVETRCFSTRLLAEALGGIPNLEVAPREHPNLWHTESLPQTFAVGLFLASGPALSIAKSP